ISPKRGAVGVEDAEANPGADAVSLVISRNSRMAASDTGNNSARSCPTSGALSIASLSLAGGTLGVKNRRLPEETTGETFGWSERVNHRCNLCRNEIDHSLPVAQ